MEIERPKRKQKGKHPKQLLKQNTAPPDTKTASTSILVEECSEVTPDCVNDIQITLVPEVEDQLTVDECTEATASDCGYSASKTSDTKTFEKLLQVNKELLKDLRLSEMEITTTLQNENKITPTSTQCIKAYGESQLSALYMNTELEAVKHFASQFVEAELKGIAVKRHPLYELLETYLQARSRLTGNMLECDQLRQEYKETQGQIWNTEVAIVTGHGLCCDGVTVSASHSYNKATFHGSMFQTVGRILQSLQKVVTETHVLYSYLSEVSKQQIELYLQTITADFMNVSQIQQNAAVSLVIQNVAPNLIPILCEIRLCISVLFSFQRRLIRDTQFLKETRDWLGRLVALLLRMANWQDHLFLLNHILRCPPGVGAWASSFVQTPLPHSLDGSPFSNFQVNHVMAVLSVILMPIQRREQFLEQIAQSRENPEDALWVIVDSEGEEDEELSGTALRENDLVQLFNQLPLDNLFRVSMLIQYRDGQDHFDPVQLTEHHLLRFLAFSTVLLRILHQGLNTYINSRYHQFSKRLCRSMRHIVQYVTDQWEYFKCNNKLNDLAMLERLQVEYDAFFLRATNYLYSSQRMGAWQFLAVVPYHMVSIRTLWRIFYLLHNNDISSEVILDPTDVVDYGVKVWGDALRTQFEEKLNVLDDAECYYLLNTFANMALARQVVDMDFIRAILKDLLQVGFISETTQESCSKTARILLTHITSKHNHLISQVLTSVKKNFDKTQELSLYLFEELPLSVWLPSETDMENIAIWLIQNEITTNQSRLSRMILSRLNWGFTPDGVLFLPYHLHFRVALLLTQIVEQDVGYLPWAWQTAFRLRLHITDKGFTEITKIAELDNINQLSRGVREQKPFPCFLGLLMTSWGHLVPLVCTRGLTLLEVLQTHQKFDALLYALNLIVPLFINCQESLINCEKFQSTLVSLLNADKTYVNMAKNLIVTHNPILEQFGNMIEYQIENFKWYNLDSPKCLVRLWINSLVSVPSWNKDPGILYLLDIILRGTFFYTDALDAAISILRELLQSTTPQENTPSIISLFKWASQSNAAQGTLLSSNLLPNCPWLAYILIGLEHEEREKQTGLWKELLTQLRNQKGKVNVDAAIKKASVAVRVPSFTSPSLCIYRWAQQALYTPLEHPLLPLLWQGFFTLFLARVPIISVADRGCVGEKFFDGIVNLSFLKRLKKRLHDSAEYYQKQTEECDNNADVTRKYFYENCQRLFRAYTLWLEEPRLQDANLHLPSLPPQYLPQLITLILQGSSFPWLEYIDQYMVKLEQQKSVRLWQTLIYREKTNVNQPLPNPGSGMESNDPVERILRRLTSYDVPKSAPAITKVAPIIPNIDINNPDVIKKLLDVHFQTLKQFARNHSVRVSEHKALDSAYRDLVRQLFRSVMYKIKKQVVCQGNSSTVCTGAATITLEMQESRINERIEHQITSNRNDYDLLLSKSLQAPAHSLCMASVSVQKTISLLQIHKDSNHAISEMAVELFYQILSLMSDEVMFYPPTSQFLGSCLEKLGQVFICGVEFETPRILNKILEEPKLVSLLSPYFSPVNIGTVNFLHMYSTICNDAGRNYEVALSLLSKFDISNWLISKQPKLSQRTQFIELVIKGLCSLNHNPATESLPLHEVYCTHLICIFEYQFPEHYGDVLTALLKNSDPGTDNGGVSVNVWISVLNSLAKPLKLKCNPSSRDQLRQYAQQQHILNYQELLETAKLLASHFSNERLQYGLYGLYPKFRNYMDVFVLLIGMTGHALIINALNTHQGLLGDKICEIIWPYLRDVFAPWVLPYLVKDNTSSAMQQQLTDDRAVLLPWISADAAFAQKAVHMLFECVQFIIHTLPACNNILSFVWQWYVTSFAHPTVKEHVLNVVHASFLALPWHNFWPSVVDLEFMLKVVEQYSPECHTFLGHIFMEVSWTNWVSQLSSTASPQVILRVHQCLLYLLVKLPSEPNVKSNHSQKAKALLVHAEAFNWDIIEPTVFIQILDWYIISCDPLVLFVTDPMNLDFRVLHFLQRVAHYDRPIDIISLPILHKRHIYVRSFIKLMSILASKHKNIVRSKEKELSGIITCSLVHVESVVKSEDELKILVEEMFSLLNIDGIRSVAVTCFEKWITLKSSHDAVLKVALQSIGSCVGDCDVAALLYETVCNSFFLNNNACDDTVITWKHLSSLIKPFPPKQAQLEQVLLAQGKILSLNALLLHKATHSSDTLALMNTILQWLNNIKVTTSIEDKLPLLWSEFIVLSLIHCDIDEASTGAVLYKFAQLLIQICGEKAAGGWGKGILGAIGLVKQDGLSLKFRFLCRAMAGFVLAQLPDAKGGVQIVRRSSNAPATVGQPGGNTECVKVLLGLDFGQSQGEIKNCAELALKQIQNPGNSLHSARKFLAQLVNQLYTKPYLRDIDS